jgi:hypothetical protein
MKRTIPGMLVLLITLAACAAPGGTPGGPSDESTEGSASDPPASGSGDQGAIEHPAGDVPVVVVEEVGGFAMVDMLATRVPTFVMLGDGRVIVQGAQTLEFPGPALPPLIERTLTEDGIQQVLAAFEETNLFAGDLELRGAMNVIADATDTVFRVNANGHETTVSVYGLGLLDPNQPAPQGIPASEIQAHAVLSDLRDALMMLDTHVSADGWESEGWQPYQPAAFRLYVRDVTDQPVEGGDLPGQVREWPTDDDPAAFGAEESGFGDGTRCGVVEGDLATTWLAELEAANQNTLWTDDGERRFSVRARPLLPGEEPACPELFGA